MARRDRSPTAGHDTDRERYRALSEQVRSAFNAEYVSPAGRVVSDAQTAYALALQCGLLTHDAQRARAGRRLAELVREQGHRIATGFVGATTIWERWDSLLPGGRVNPGEMTSFNHYALGAVADWMHRTVAGLAPAAPGYRHLLVRPRPGGDLQRAMAAHETPYGRAEVPWERRGGTLEVDVVVPPGATASVTLPADTVEPFEVWGRAGTSTAYRSGARRRPHARAGGRFCPAAGRLTAGSRVGPEPRAVLCRTDSEEVTEAPAGIVRVGPADEPADLRHRQIALDQQGGGAFGAEPSVECRGRCAETGGEQACQVGR